MASVDDNKPTDEVRKAVSPNAAFYLKQFINECGAHGFNKFENSGLVRRIIWTVIIIIAMITLLFTIVKEIITYYEYPTLTKFEVRKRSFITFPTVTICNFGTESKAKVPYADDPRYDEYYFSVFSKTDQTGIISAPEVNWNDPFYSTNNFFNQRTRENLLQQATSTEQLIKQAIFDGISMNVSRVLTTLITNIGVCHSFNLNGTFTTKEYGQENNLILHLNINQSDYTYSGYITTAGAKVHVHRPDTLPDMLHEGVFLEPGKMSYVEISETMTQYQPFPYRLSDGSYCKESAMDYKLCLQLCYQKEIQKACGCTDGSLNMEPICSLYDMLQCVPSATNIIRNKTLSEICDCTVPCSSTVYDVSISSSIYPSQFFADKMKGRYGVDLFQLFRENYLVVNICFKDLGLSIVQQVPKYASIIDVLSNLGGLMGLLIGASLLTLVDLIELIWFLLMTALTRSKRKIENKCPYEHKHGMD